MADGPEIVPIEEVPRKPPYPHGGLNGLQFMALDTGDADSMLERLQWDEKNASGPEVVSAIPYRFNGGAQPGYVVVLYDKTLDPFYDNDRAVHPPKSTEPR